MVFAGTTQKCMACDKTVYLVDKLNADNRSTTRHVSDATIARAHSSWRITTLSRECSIAGHISTSSSKELESLDKSFEGTPKIAKPDKPADTEKTHANKVSSMFAGTREKCLACKNTVYPTEKVSVNGTPYHKSCFKCTHGGCIISPLNYIAHEGRLYCKHHHIQLIKEKGNLSQLEGDKDSVRTPTLPAES